MCDIMQKDVDQKLTNLLMNQFNYLVLSYSQS